MQYNVGREDKIVRFVAGVFVIGAGFYYGSYLGVIGVVLVLTALFGLLDVAKAPEYKQQKIEKKLIEK